jgi:hypothetical protein
MTLIASKGNIDPSSKHQDAVQLIALAVLQRW